jgi:multicomponent Na+:H+ antiporter subunit E
MTPGRPSFSVQGRGTNGGPEAAAPAMVSAALARGAGFFGFWLLLAGPGVLNLAAETESGGLARLAWDMVVGLLSAMAATSISLRLLPPARGRVRCGLLARLSARFLGQSIVAGIDVARRAFDPRLPLSPGYIAYPLRIRTEPGRAVFGAYTSLMPGTLPVGSDAQGALVYHCLDLEQPVAAGLAKDEALLRQVTIEGEGDE